MKPYIALECCVYKFSFSLCITPLSWKLDFELIDLSPFGKILSINFGPIALDLGKD